MATRYWVGGSGTWTSTSTANWSFSSGGPPGASAPGQADDVIFDENSGSGTVTLGTGLDNISMRNFTSTAFTGTFAAGAFNTLKMFGNVATGTAGPTNQFSSIGFIITSSDTDTTINIPRKLDYININKSNSNNTTILSTITADAVIVNVTVNSPNTFSTQEITASTPSFFLIAGSGTASIGDLLNSGSGVWVVTSNMSSAVTFPSIQKLQSFEQRGSGNVVISSIPVNAGGLLSLRRRSNSGTLTVPALGSTYRQIYLIGEGGVITGINSLTATSFISLSYYSLSSVTITGPSGSLSLNAGSTLTSYNASNQTTSLSLEMGSVGTNSIGTLTYNTSSGGQLTLNSDVTINSLNVSSGSSSSKISVVSNSFGVQRKLNANSFNLSNIFWRDIDADGTVPFTGSGFEDGGNNLDIQFLLPINGLFFGSNF